MKSLLVSGLLAAAVAGVGVYQYATHLRELASIATGYEFLAKNPPSESKTPPAESKEPPVDGGVIG